MSNMSTKTSLNQYDESDTESKKLIGLVLVTSSHQLAVPCKSLNNSPTLLQKTSPSKNEENDKQELLGYTHFEAVDNLRTHLTSKEVWWATWYRNVATHFPLGIEKAIRGYGRTPARPGLARNLTDLLRVPLVTYLI